MAAGEFNILADQGANYVLYFVYETNSSAAIDLTGYQGRMQVRRSAYSEDTSPKAEVLLVLVVCY